MKSKRGTLPLRACSANTLSIPRTVDISRRVSVLADKFASMSFGRAMAAYSSTKNIVLRPPRPMLSPASPVIDEPVVGNVMRMCALFFLSDQSPLNSGGRYCMNTRPL